MENQPEESRAESRQILSRRASKWLLNFKILLAIALAAGVFLGLYHVLKATYLDRRVSRFFPHNWVNLDDRNNAVSAASGAATTTQPVFRVAIAPIVAPEKSLEMYQDFIDYIAGRLGRRPVPLYRPTYSETNDLIRYQRCDIAVVCTYPFIRGEREFGMQALVVPRVKGETTYQSLVIVPSSSSAKSLFDLRGKRFGSGDIVSTTGWLFPAMTLMASGEDPNRFFGEHVITGSHDRSVQAVVDGYVDAAAVHGIVYDQLVAEDPSLLKKLRILVKSPPFGIPPVVVHPAMDPELRKATQAILLDMHNDPRGREILEKLGIEKYVIPEKGLFGNLRQAVSRLEGWK